MPHSTRSFDDISRFSDAARARARARACDGLRFAAGFIRDGRLKPIVVSGARRTPSLPEIPTLIAAVLMLPAVRERYLSEGFEPVGNTPSEFAAQIKSDLARWNKVVKDANIRIE